MVGIPEIPALAEPQVRTRFFHDIPLVDGFKLMVESDGSTIVAGCIVTTTEAGSFPSRRLSREDLQQMGKALATAGWLPRMTVANHPPIYHVDVED